MELLKVIKFEGDDRTLVYKHPDEDFNTQSQLIVHESQEAILYRDGRALDLFGPGKHELKTENIPILRGLINLPTEGVSPFHVEVYFINKAVSLNVEWGTSSRFQVLDPMFNIPLNVGASGSMEFVVDNSRKFLIKVVGTQDHIDTNTVIYYFKEKTTTKIKTYLAKIMSEVSYLNINQHLTEISEALQQQLNEDFEDYGINLVNFYVSTIVIPDEDTVKVKEVLNKKMEYGTLDFNWADEQIADISKRYASNSGINDGVGGAVAQLPLAFAFGEMLKDNVADGMNNPFSNKTQAFKTNNDTNEEKKPVFCTNCGEEIRENMKFCHSCGQKLETELTCPECGEVIQPSDKFCGSCGNKL
ncbi:MAG: SPFH domain-containing protein [Methanosphaera sp.]|nr:SPFH domain-containing protein [Methanosphaera sp.]